MTIMDTFNNREIAIGVWIVFSLALVLANAVTRRSLGGMARAFCQRQILFPLGLMLLWIALAIYGLRAFGFWNAGQLNTTIIWAVSVAAMSFFRLPSIAESPDYFKRAIRDNLKLIVVLEFIVSSYTFGLLAELAIVPASALIGGTLAIAGRNEKYGQVETFINGVTVAFGIVLIANAIIALFDDFAAFATLETLADFMLPIVLGLLLLPFLFAMTVFLNYELAFSRLRIFVADDDLRSYARHKAVLRFRLDSVLARRWAHDLASLDRRSKVEIDASIDQLRAMRAAEKNPPPVPASAGWSPYLAKSFLASADIEAGHYHPIGGQDWNASSPYKEFGDGLLPNNLAYNVDGTRDAATSLRLVLNVNDPDSSAEAHGQLLSATKALHQAALGSPMPEDIADAIIAGRQAQFSAGGDRVAIAKEEWGDERRRGYRLGFNIER